MSVEYIDRDTGWRNRGRPRVAAEPRVVEAVKYTYESGKVGRLTIAPQTDPAEVRETITQLRRAAEHLGLRLRLQPRRSSEILAEGQLRFFAEDE